MSIKSSLITVGIVAAVVAVAAYYAKGKIAGLGNLIPPVVRDGFEAGSVLAWGAASGIMHPLDALGISPGNDVYGVAKYETTAPWLNKNDPVSNNDTGINWNYF